MNLVPSPLRATARAIVAAALLGLLAACAAPAPEADREAAGGDGAAGKRDAVEPTPASAPADPPAKPAGTIRQTGGPLPPERIEDRPVPPDAGKPATGKPAPAAPDASCRTDADCTVKNVGNCCGYYPACVNVNARTDPEGVRAACAKDGMAGMCGFPEIRSCSCMQGSCQAADATSIAPVER
jgi:hypothetical protein